MKKLGIFGCVLVFSLMLAMSVQAAGLLSPAIDVLQEDCAVLKTGVGKNTVTFSEEDFLSVFGESEFLGIVVTELPSLSDGVLKLGAVDVGEGQIIAKNAIKALRFIPAEAGKTASFGFLPYGKSYENDFICTVYMLDSLNFAPTANGGTLSAVEGIPVYAAVSADDPDGDMLTYRLEEAPKKGRLTLSLDGSYRYIANAGAEGEDSFTYVLSTPTATAPSPVRSSSIPKKMKAVSFIPICKTKRTHILRCFWHRKMRLSEKRSAMNGIFIPKRPLRAENFS